MQARTPPLIVASKDNCLEIVELLLAYSANINIRDKVSAPYILFNYGIIMIIDPLIVHVVNNYIGL